jgi:hypothetical protein
VGIPETLLSKDEREVVFEAFSLLHRKFSLLSSDDREEDITKEFEDCFSKMDLDDFYDVQNIAKGFEAFTEFCSLCLKVSPESRWQPFAAQVSDTILPALHDAIDSAMTRLGETPSNEEAADIPNAEELNALKASLLKAYPLVYEALRSKVRLETIKSNLNYYYYFHKIYLNSMR